MKENVFLIGFMASGKTTIGKMLAKELNFQFIDTDHLVENECGLDIPQIFELHGENHFRQLETKALYNIVKKKHQVISVGGGLPIFNENLSSMLQSGIVIYLKCSFKHSYKRLQIAKNRPLANKLNKTELLELYRKRLIFYKQAHFTVLSNREIQNVVKRILTLIDINYT